MALPGFSAPDLRDKDVLFGVTRLPVLMSAYGFALATSTA
jgi:hypothetical protein